MFQVGIECIKALKGRDGHQEITPRVPHQALYLAFVIALAGAAEPVLEQVVGLQLDEGPGALAPAVAQDTGHRQPGIVVEDALGNSAQKGKRRYVPIQEGLGGLGRIGLSEAAVAVGQVDDEAVDPYAPPRR